MFRIGWLPEGRGAKRTRAEACRLAAALFTALLALSCIERSNPFDPVNSQGAEAIRKKLQSQLENLASGEEVHAGLLAEFSGVFMRDSGWNAQTAHQNAERLVTNGQISGINDSIERANDEAPAASLVPKRFFWYLDTLSAYGPWPKLDAGQSALRTQIANLVSFMVAANSEHTPVQVYPAPFSDSVLQPFLRDSSGLAALKARVDDGNRAVADSNLAIRGYNEAKAGENDSVAAYNEFVAFMNRARNWPVITKPDSVGPVFSRVKPGDTVLIGKGVYDIQTRIEVSGTSDKNIVVSGYPGGGTVLRAGPDGGGTVLFVAGASYVRFQDIVFRGGNGRGVKLEDGCQNVRFDRCVFDSSTIGLEVVDSDVELVDCRLIANGTGAYLQGADSSEYTILLENVLVARNTGHGLLTNSPWGRITKSTLSDNGGDGFSVVSPHGRLELDKSIISGNRGTGIYRMKESGYQDVFHVDNCDVWGNQANDWSLAGMDSLKIDALKRTNISEDPGFKDPSRFDYSLAPGSALIEFENRTVPVIIGYRP